MSATLFERFTNIWSRDQDQRIAMLTAANAEMHDALAVERMAHMACKEALRPFLEYVDAADAHGEEVSADAAAQRDEAAEAGDGDGDHIPA